MSHIFKLIREKTFNAAALLLPLVILFLSQMFFGPGVVCSPDSFLSFLPQMELVVTLSWHSLEVEDNVEVVDGTN